MARANTRVGSRVAGRFRLRRILDTGGTATVWYADDELAGGTVALKLLHPKLRRSSAHRDRAKREADVLARLSHTNITRFIAADLGHEQPYIAMSHASGPTLAQDIEQRREASAPPSAARLLAWFEEIIDAVDHAHRHGVVHRDLKPSNIVLGETGVFVLDFGIAKLLSRDEDDATTRGRSIGTFAYMAPEQARGEAVDARTDIFALGTLLFEAATLTRAFGTSRDTPDNILARMVEGARPKVSSHRPELAALDDVVERALAVDVDSRTPTVEAFRTELRAALLPPKQPPRSLVGSMAIAAVAAITLAALSWWFWPSETPEPRKLSSVIEAPTAVAPRVAPILVAESTTAAALETPPPATKSPPRRRPARTAAVEAKTKRIDPLTRQLRIARRNPTDVRALGELARMLEREATKLDDAAARARVQRLVNVGLMMRRLDGLERAHAELEAARK